MTKVIVVGPNLPDQSKGSFHVHAVGCSDLNHYGREFDSDKANPLDVSGVEEIADYVYDFEENPREYVNDIYVFPCVHWNYVPIPKEVAMTAVTFELYNEDMFLEMTIETSDLDATLSMLESVPNVRNIRY